MDKKEENQKKIAYLKKYKYAILDEKMILEEIQKLRADKMFPSLAMDGMPHGNGTSDLSEYAARLDEEINKLKVQRLEKVKKIPFELIQKKYEEVDGDPVKVWNYIRRKKV